MRAIKQISCWHYNRVMGYFVSALCNGPMMLSDKRDHIPVSEW